MPTAGVLRVLLARLIDDAGLFPPALLPMPDALAANRSLAAADHAAVIGRFLAPASRLEEFALAAGRSRPELGIVVDTLGTQPDEAEVEAVATVLGKYEPTSVEVLAANGSPLMATVGILLAGFAGLPDGTSVYVELPRGDALADWPRAIETLGAARAGGRNVGAKVRCAMTANDEAPSDEDLARFVIDCRDGGTPFKATAGLHHAIRHTQTDGLERHGFLNLLLGCAVALRADSGADDVAMVLAERDPAVVVDGIDSLSVEDAARVRTELLTGFGCCDPTEPIDDLRALGLLEGF
jgi:hypothetical protein